MCTVCELRLQYLSCFHLINGTSHLPGYNRPDNKLRLLVASLVLITLISLMSFIRKDSFFDDNSDPNLVCVRVSRSRKMRLGHVACIGRKEMQTKFGRKTCTKEPKV